jgi:hypothetical protein
VLDVMMLPPRVASSKIVSSSRRGIAAWIMRFDQRCNQRIPWKTRSLAEPRKVKEQPGPAVRLRGADPLPRKVWDGDIVVTLDYSALSAAPRLRR